MHPMMNVAIKAARNAGTVISRAALNIERLQVARKQQNDYVTEVDRAAEAAVIEVLREAYPHHNFLAEETGYIRADGEQLGAMSWEDAVRQDDPDQDHHVWVIDPLDGTTNFILSEMRDKGSSFDDVLKEAQRLGYAEADPTFDIEGIDAAHKASIMSAIAFGVPVQFDKAHIEGITKLEPIDIQYAEQLGYRIKLLGITKKTSHGIELRVHPTLIPSKRLIASVEGAMNAVQVQGDAVGTTLYYGKGAGSEATASAVIADLVDVVRYESVKPNKRVPYLAFQEDKVIPTVVMPIGEITTSYYLRLKVSDEKGVLANITKILADNNISIDALLQKEAAQGESQTDLVILTHQTQEKYMLEAIQSIELLGTVKGAITKIRLEELS